MPFVRLLSLFLTFLSLAVSASEVKYKCDDPYFNESLGKYCYHIQDYTASYIFYYHNEICTNLHGYLAGFDNLNDQKWLLDRVKEIKGDDFTPFYIGLYCATAIPGNSNWAWENTEISFNPDAVSFEKPIYNTNTIACDTEDPNTNFVLTNESKWRDVSGIHPEEPINFVVCQKNAIDANENPSDGDDKTTDKPPDPQPFDDTTLIIGLILVCFILIVFIVVMMIRFRKKISQLMSQIIPNSLNVRRKHSENVVLEKEQTIAKTKDEWELGRQFVNIKFSSRLGRGAFGVVYLGEIDVERLPQISDRSLLQLSAFKLNNGRVAVKMLHESADKLAELDFLQEIELMKSIGYHERLVNIIAAVTESLPHLLITEYCSHGDLLSYLKDRREYMLQLSRDADYSLIDHKLVVTQEQQLQFAVQIAYGLEFLSGRGFVHRDIAARNILVDERNGCKIGDFGLCRRVQEEQELYLSRGGRLPIKWMSPEALRRYEMSTASDVWSYGILLFEIITLGGSPYPNWAPAEILPRLEAGERMDRPDNCPDAVYEAMTDCWSDIPMKRPDFTTLRCRLAKALEESPNEYYLQLDSQRDYYLVPKCRDLPVSEEEFIRII